MISEHGAVSGYPHAKTSRGVKGVYFKAFAQLLLAKQKQQESSIARRQQKDLRLHRSIISKKSQDSPVTHTCHLREAEQDGWSS